MKMKILTWKYEKKIITITQGQVVNLFTGLKRGIPSCHSGVVTCWKLSQKYEIKN